MNPLRVLRIIPSVDPRRGGPIEGLLQQAKVHAQMGIETELASLDEADAPFIGACPLRVHALGTWQASHIGWKRFLPWAHYGYAPAFVPWLRAHAEEYNLAVVEGLWTYATMGARRALTGGRLPYVVFTHGMLAPWFRKTHPLKNAAKQLLWLYSEGPLLNHAGFTLFTTEDERILSRNAFYPYRVIERVVGFGTGDIAGDAETQRAAFRSAMPALGTRRYLLFLGRIHPIKGIDLLIEAFAQVAGSHPDLDLVIGGPDQTGLCKALTRRAVALGIGERIHWPGMLTGDVKWGAFRGAVAFVLPSHQENFGVVVVEAMAAGVPVLISDKVNIWCEVKDSGGGLVESDDVDGAIRLLRGFLNLTAAERLTMGKRARAGFLDHFEITKAAVTIAKAMQEAASS